MSELRTRIDENLKTALKAKDTVAGGTIRLIKSAIKDKDIAVRDEGDNEGISDDAILGLLQTMIKQREESFQTYQNAGRQDLADREVAEMEIIRSFLPEPLDEAGLVAAVESAVAQSGATGMRDMGKVMTLLKANYPGRIDMAAASAAVKQKLA